MIIHSDGYLSLIEYLTENLSLFKVQDDEACGNTTLKQFIRYQLVEQMTLIFNQHKELSVDDKVYIVDEFEHVFSDLSEVLGRLLKHSVNQKQRVFITDYVSLLKNMFDSQLEAV